MAFLDGAEYLCEAEKVCLNDCMYANAVSWSNIKVLLDVKPQNQSILGKEVEEKIFEKQTRWVGKRGFPGKEELYAACLNDRSRCIADRADLWQSLSSGQARALRKRALQPLYTTAEYLRYGWLPSIL